MSIENVNLDHEKEKSLNLSYRAVLEQVALHPGKHGEEARKLLKSLDELKDKYGNKKKNV